jgi:hypothetical protein
MAEGSRRYSGNKFNDDIRVHLTDYRLIRGLRGNWAWFWIENVESGKITLNNVPFPDVNMIVYGSYSMFTNTSLNRIYTYNGKTYIQDNDGDFYVYEAPIETNSTWVDIILASDELIERVRDRQHS